MKGSVLWACLSIVGVSLFCGPGSVWLLCLCLAGMSLVMGGAQWCGCVYLLCVCLCLVYISQSCGHVTCGRVASCGHVSVLWGCLSVAGVSLSCRRVSSCRYVSVLWVCLFAVWCVGVMGVCLSCGHVSSCGRVSVVARFSRIKAGVAQHVTVSPFINRNRTIHCFFIIRFFSQKTFV